MSDFKRINEELNISVLINIHHVDLALKYATRVIGIRAGDRFLYEGHFLSCLHEHFCAGKLYRFLDLIRRRDHMQLLFFLHQSGI